MGLCESDCLDFGAFLFGEIEEEFRWEIGGEAFNFPDHYYTSYFNYL